MDILIITDINAHEETEDFYPIIREIKSRGDEVYVLDRAVESNSYFFDGLQFDILNCYKVDTFNLNLEKYKNRFTHVKAKQENNFDLIILRIDRPVSDKLLLHIKNVFSKTPIINDPLGVIKTSSKKHLFLFEELCPPMRICTSLDDVIAFSKKFPIVIKPLHGYGGKGIFKISNGKYYYEKNEIDFQTFQDDISVLLKKESECLGVKFLKNIKNGDKRIYVVNNKIIGAFNRVPEKNSWLANLSQGAHSEVTTISKREELIVKKVSTLFDELGIFIYGIDIIEGDDGEAQLSEINTLNVGGCQVIDKMYEINSTKNLVDSLYKLVKNQT